MFFLSEIILFVLNVVIAEWHCHLKDANIKYSKDLYVIGYIGITFCLCAIEKSLLLLPASLLIHKLVYDTAYNLFRGLPLFFVSTSPTSFIDRIHFYFLGKNSEIYLIIYFLLILTINGAVANL